MTDLETPRLHLCDFSNDDFEDVHAYASDPEVTRQLSWGPNTPSETRDFLKRAQQGILEVPRESFDWAITRKSDGRVIGGCGLYHRTGNKAEFEIGYCLARSAWGQGFGKEMIKVVLEYGLSTLRARRIIALSFRAMNARWGSQRAQAWYSRSTSLESVRLSRRTSLCCFTCIGLRTKTEFAGSPERTNDRSERNQYSRTRSSS